MELIMYYVLAVLVGSSVPRAALGRRRASLLARGLVFVMTAVAIAFTVTCAATLFHIASDPPPSRKDTLIRLISVIGLSPIWVAMSMARRRVIDSSQEAGTPPTGEAPPAHVDDGVFVSHQKAMAANELIQRYARLRETGAMDDGPGVPSWREPRMADVNLDLNRAPAALRRKMVDEGRAEIMIDRGLALNAARSSVPVPHWTFLTFLGAPASLAAATGLAIYGEWALAGLAVIMAPVCFTVTKAGIVRGVMRAAEGNPRLENLLIRKGVIWYRMR